MSTDTGSDLAELEAILGCGRARKQRDRAPVSEFGVDFGLDKIGVVRTALGCVLASHNADQARLADLFTRCNKAELRSILCILAVLVARLESREATERRALCAGGLLPQTTASS